jgi:hypothetical protein
MAQRLVRFSDLTNKMIQDDEVVRIVIEQHPALQNGPVELEAAPDEVEAIRTSVLNVVSLKLYQDDSTSPEIVTMEIEAFNRLAGDMDMEDVLRKAQPASIRSRQAGLHLSGARRQATPREDHRCREGDRQE